MELIFTSPPLNSFMSDKRKIQGVSLIEYGGKVRAVTLGDLKKISTIILAELMSIPEEKKTNADRALVVKLIKETRDTMQQISLNHVMSKLKKQAGIPSK